MESINLLLEKIKALPPLNDNVIKIQNICFDKDKNINDLLDIIENDPMLAADILKSSNSPFFGFSKTIRTVKQAVLMFGMHTIFGFALSNSIKTFLKVDLSVYNTTQEKLVELSLIQSAFINKWLSNNKELLESIQPIVFVMEIGKIIIANYLYETKTTKQFYEEFKTIKTIEELFLLEKKYCGYTSLEICALVFEMWNFEETFVQILKCSNSLHECENPFYKQQGSILIITQLLFNVLSKEPNQQTINDALSLAKSYGFKEDSLKKVLNK